MGKTTKIGARALRMVYPAADEGLCKRCKGEIDLEDGSCATCDPREDPPIHRVKLTKITEEQATALLKEHAGLVHQFARRLMPRADVVHWIELGDLITCGQIAVLEAAASYDAERGAKMGTWCATIIRRRMMELVRRARGQKRGEQQTAVRLHSINKRTEARKRAAAQGRPEPVYTKADPPQPTVGELEALKETLGHRSVSASVTVTQGDETSDFSLFDVVPADPEAFDPAVIAERQTKMKWLKQAMRRLLTPNERQAVFAALQGEDGFELSERLGVSRQRIAQLRDHGLKKLRWAAREMGWIEVSDNPEEDPEDPPLRLRPRRVMPPPVPV